MLFSEDFLGFLIMKSCLGWKNEDLKMALSNWPFKCPMCQV